MKLSNLLGQNASDGGFLGLPRCRELAALDADIALLGAPIATPYAALGTYAAGAPAAIRAGLADVAGSLSHMDFDFREPLLGDAGARAVDCGDLVCDEKDAAGNRARISAAVRTILERGARPLVLGGDDSVPIPVFEAFAGHGEFTVLQVDAHIDWRDDVGGERLGLSSTMRRASEMAHVARIVQVGARGIGSARPADYQAARDFGVSFVFADEVHEHGVQAAIDAVPAGADVLVSIDCDGLDPSIMPAVIGPSPGGLQYWQVVRLLRGVADRARLAGLDIVEFMPSRDIGGLAALTAARLLATAIGLMARQAR